MATQFVTLAESNLYADGQILVLPNAKEMILRKRYTYRATEGDRYYTIRLGDMIDKISYLQYQDETENAGAYWWLIADANKIADPTNLDALAGQTIVIPNISIAKIERYG